MDFSTFARSKGALPIDEALPRLTEALAAFPRAVMVAPPGAGKTLAFRWPCSTPAGAATARSSCWSRAASPPAPPPNAWRAFSTKVWGKTLASACACNRR